MRRAGIDIGSNTMLMVIADIDEDGSYKTLREYQEYPRLGEAVEATGVIQDQAILRARDVATAYKQHLDEFEVTSVTSVATSALRVAKNGREVRSVLEDALGHPITIVDGKCEAELTFLGTVGADTSPVTVIDIGGGSTEITSGVNGAVSSIISKEIGSVRFCEKYFKHGSISNESYSRLRQDVQSHFGDESKLVFPAETEFVGVSGTPTALAMLQFGLPEYDELVIHGKKLVINDVQSLVKRLFNNPQDTLGGFTGISKSRGEILPAGAAILLEIMEIAEIDEVTVSTRGLRHGALLQPDGKLRKPMC